MRTLPDNPHLDHLRRQAKDLLAGLRDADPSASLADAQAALARQYGFRTWTELKTEVDRAHGHHDEADPAVARAIAERFGLGTVTATMRSVARTDHVGRPYLLVTDRGRWVVRTTENWIPIVDADMDVALQEAAAVAGVTLPTPVRSTSGAAVEEIAGHRWRCRQWRNSGPPFAAPVSSVHGYAIGGVLATIHGLGMPVDRISPWHAERLFTDSWADLAATGRAQGAGWAVALAAAVPALVDLEAIGQGEPAAPPPRLCHNTLGPAAVRLGAGGRLVVFEWEHAGGQPPSWELADVLWHWTVDPTGEVNTACVRAIVDGYRARAASLPSLTMGAFRGAATSMANYVHGEISQALHAGDDEQRRHADRSVRHVLSHLPTRGTFEQLLEVAAG